MPVSQGRRQQQQRQKHTQGRPLPSRQRSGRSRRPLFIGGALALVVVVLAVLAIRSCGASPTDGAAENVTQAKVQSVTETATANKSQLPASASLGVDPLNQGPELESGCEATALTMVLNYLGFKVDKTEIAADYLPCEPIGEATLDEAFAGDPFTNEGCGCNAPVIVASAEAYLSGNATGKCTVTDLTNSDFTTLLGAVAEGDPICIWVTTYMDPLGESTSWTTPDGTVVEWYGNEHCMTLVGYDLDEQLVYLADPLVGEVVTYTFADCIESYLAMGSQAVRVHVS